MFHPTNDGAVLEGVSGDLTGDGWAEVVIGGWSYRGFDATGTPPSVPFLIVSTGPGGGKLLDAATVLGRASTPGTQSLRMGDFNNDGKLDLFVDGHNESPFFDTQSTLYLNNGNGTLRPIDAGPKGTFHNGEIGDLNGDGKLDFIGAGYSVAKAFDPRLYAPGSYQMLDNHQGIVAFLGDGRGGFKALPFSYNMSLADVALGKPGRINWGLASDATTADLDGDGKAEIIAVDLLNSADSSPTVGNSWIFTNIRSDTTSIWGDQVVLPKPYFEGNAKYSDVPSDLSTQRSHDVAVNPFDFDNDGDLDLVVSSMIFHQNGYGASMLQFLRNDGKLKFTDVTDTTIYNSYVARADPGKNPQLIDVNGDAFKDIVIAEPGTYGSDGTLDKSWSNEVYLNTGSGKFVSVMWNQFHALTGKLADAAKASGLNLFYPGNVESEFYPYLTPDGRLGFVTTTSGFANGSGAYTQVVFTVEADTAMSTGPGGINPALQGAPGFSEVYYLTEHPDVAAMVKAGTYASGLAHWLAVGKAAGWTGFANGATVRGSDGKDTITLREGAETAYGLAGNDTLIGGAGNDTLAGGAGNDQLLGGSGYDTASYTGATSRVVVSLLLKGAQSTLGGGTDTLAAIENITGSSYADTLTGNGLANVLAGGDGTDVLKGNAGSDTLNGGAGADRMFGGVGNDTYHVDVSGDRLYETATTSGTDTTDLGGKDTVISSIGYTLGKFIENLTLTGSANLAGTGNALANTLNGNDGANTLKGLLGDDILKGGGGNDKLFGGDGKDTLSGGTGQDSFVFNTAPTSRDTITDFSRADGDKIQLSKAVFKGFAYTGTLHADDFYAAAGSTTAHDANDRVIYNTTTGVLYYDADGLGGAAAVQVALLGASKHPALAYGDLQIFA
ncbi:FG-GAP-like repeat-containing protein [Novosphingobium sp. PASSN1]|uniref:FG-GAP-like repeat-containing protein n=1 Tax=Novosphingobium sp. PASSN1 TaxID=2015561 RepID=UPI0025CE3BB2|nr:FG-GAP-like repeat-containing protein [Novosphingobium sp. PASSN1]